jgi:hypothetical protein
MALPDLIAMHTQLIGEPVPSGASTIVALRVPGESHYHLGLTQQGQLCALIETIGRRSGVDIRLRNLEIRQDVCCRVRTPDASEQDVTGSLVVCHAEQPSLMHLFLRLYAEAINDLGPAPSADDVSTWLQRLSMLLSRLEQDGRKRLQGLWAELLVIRELGAPELLIRRWRPDPKERFDFLAAGFALEVKSCPDFERVHEFSLEQLRPPEGLDAWVASVVVRGDPSGMSVLDLLGELETQLADPIYRQTLREITLATGGAALEEDDRYRFNGQLAGASLRLLEVSAIPRLQGDRPPEIISVSLRVKCDGVAEAGSRHDVVRRLHSSETYANAELQPD